MGTHGTRRVLICSCLSCWSSWGIAFAPSLFMCPQWACSFWVFRTFLNEACPSVLLLLMIDLSLGLLLTCSPQGQCMVLLLLACLAASRLRDAIGHRMPRRRPLVCTSLAWRAAPSA